MFGFSSAQWVLLIVMAAVTLAVLGYAITYWVKNGEPRGGLAKSVYDVERLKRQVNDLHQRLKALEDKINDEEPFT